MKLKLKGAQTGHSLLKRKSEALTKRFRGITVKIDEVKKKEKEKEKKRKISRVIVMVTDYFLIIA
jgi:vacuolar-type H+-ATPase subunit D/Vma8